MIYFMKKSTLKQYMDSNFRIFRCFYNKLSRLNNVFRKMNKKTVKGSTMSTYFNLANPKTRLLRVSCKMSKNKYSILILTSTQWLNHLATRWLTFYDHTYKKI